MRLDRAVMQQAVEASRKRVSEFGGLVGWCTPGALQLLTAPAWKTAASKELAMQAERDYSRM